MKKAATNFVQTPIAYMRSLLRLRPCCGKALWVRIALPPLRQAPGPIPARQRASPAIPPLLPGAERCPAAPCYAQAPRKPLFFSKIRRGGLLVSPSTLILPADLARGWRARCFVQMQAAFPLEGRGLLASATAAQGLQGRESGFMRRRGIRG